MPTPEESVRSAAAGYVRALQTRRWDDACERMTPAGRRAVAEGAASCAAALRAGVALPPEALGTVARQLPGARVRVNGATATLGPVADLPTPLRLERRDGRWLVSG